MVRRFLGVGRPDDARESAARAKGERRALGSAAGSRAINALVDHLAALRRAEAARSARYNRGYVIVPDL
jgi:hypothetical protein